MLICARTSNLYNGIRMSLGINNKDRRTLIVWIMLAFVKFYSHHSNTDLVEHNLRLSDQC